MRREGGTVGGQRETSPQPFLPSEPVGADPFLPFTWDTQRAPGGQRDGSQLCHLPAVKP